MLRFFIISLVCILYIPLVSANDALSQRTQKSKMVVKQFMGQLKGELQNAMKSGGPSNAIDVCNKTAPLIAKNLSDKYGWKVARTSLKTRNAANEPDVWEAKVLNMFEERKSKGEDVKSMAYSEAIEVKGRKYFRFMKAIPTGEVCLKCHGNNVAPELTAKIKEIYPDDQATGFELGDIRGAFTIIQPW
ncbi:MAG: DUF3365 domain-containing protein [Gammaproteobacteria bacterium]|nr:DUF3365 domain-containing protein [Gammaproteobacteria bacterium]